jgi:putative modified peptide
MAIKKAGAPGKAAPLDAKVASKLLDKLSTDNEFRRLFKNDPAAALTKVGHQIPADGLSGCCTSIASIAPKREILAARDALNTYLTSTSSQTVVFCFESGKVASSLRRK